MLKKLRERKNIKLIMFLTAVLIIPAFVLWGVGSALRSRYKEGLAGKVFSKKITRDEFLKLYKEVYSQALLLYGDSFSQLKDYLNLEGQTWQRIILLEEAKRKKIKVKDYEVINWIKNSPLFQKKGKFDKTSYETIISYYMGLTPREYEEQVRNNLKIKKLLDGIVKDIKVDEEFAWQEYKKVKDQYKLSYLLFKPSQHYQKVDYSKEDLINFYQENKEEFKKPEQVNILYIKSDAGEFIDKVEVSEQEIQDYYKTHKEEFKINQEEQNQNLLTDEIKDKIVKNLKEIKAKEKAEEIIWAINDKIRRGLSLEQACSQYNIKITESGFFSPWDPIPKIGWAYKIIQKAFNLKSNEVSEVIEIQNAYYIIKLKERRASYIPEFEEVETQVELAFKERKASELALKEAENALTLINLTLQDKGNLEELLEQNNLSLKQTDFLTREKYIPGIGNASDIFDNLEIKEANKFNPKVIMVPAGYLIVRIDEIKSVSKEDFQKEKDDFINQILSKRKEELLNDWFEQLRERADLEVYFKMTHPEGWE